MSAEPPLLSMLGAGLALPDSDELSMLVGGRFVSFSVSGFWPQADSNPVSIASVMAVTVTVLLYLHVVIISFPFNALGWLLRVMLWGLFMQAQQIACPSRMRAGLIKNASGTRLAISC